MKRPSRKLMLAIKVAISVLLLGYILWAVDLGGVWQTLSNVHIGLLMFSSSLFLVGYLLTSIRWSLLLAVHGVDVRIGFLVRSFLVAAFFNNLLPSSVGGDVVRVYDSWRLGLEKSGALGTIFVDRSFGVVALGVYALLGLLMGPATHLGPAGVLVLMAIFLAFGAGVLVVFMNQSLLLALAAWCESRRNLRSFGPVFRMFEPYAGETSTLWKCFATSLLLQGNVIIYYWVMAIALGLPLDLLHFALVIPIVLMVLMIPITINGIGLREGIFVLLLGGYGVSPTEAVAFSALAYLQTVVQGLIGGLVFAFRSEQRVQSWK